MTRVRTRRDLGRLYVHQIRPLSPMDDSQSGAPGSGAPSRCLALIEVIDMFPGEACRAGMYFPSIIWRRRSVLRELLREAPGARRAVERIKTMSKLVHEP